MTDGKEQLQKEKMYYVQLLASYYQQSLKLPPDAQQAELIQQILACKQQIKQINQQLSQLKDQGSGLEN
ncbi:hypothetical protein ACSFB8_06645 [Enterococcus faecalis]